MTYIDNISNINVPIIEIYKNKNEILKNNWQLGKASQDLLVNELNRLQKTFKTRETQRLLENSLKENIISLDKIQDPIDSLLILEQFPRVKLKYRIQGKIYGTLSKLYFCDLKYKTALEASAAEKLNYVVVDDINTAKNSLNYLKKNKLGRVVFLPLDNLKTYPLNILLTPNEKVLGKAIELIEFDTIYAKAFEYVFGRTIVVEDLKTALNLKINATRVTLNGEIVEPSNLISGGV